MQPTAQRLQAQQASHRPAYTHRVHYVKHFTGGILSGLKGNAHKDCLSKQAALDFINERNGWHCQHPVGGSSPYRVEIEYTEKL